MIDLMYHAFTKFLISKDYGNSNFFDCNGYRIFVDEKVTSSHFIVSNQYSMQRFNAYLNHDDKTIKFVGM